MLGDDKVNQVEESSQEQRVCIKSLNIDEDHIKNFGARGGNLLIYSRVLQSKQSLQEFVHFDTSENIGIFLRKYHFKFEKDCGDLLNCKEVYLIYLIESVFVQEQTYMRCMFLFYLLLVL